MVAHAEYAAFLRQLAADPDLQLNTARAVIGQIAAKLERDNAAEVTLQKRVADAYARLYPTMAKYLPEDARTEDYELLERMAHALYPELQEAQNVTR